MKWLLVIFAYLLGSIPTGVVVARFMGGADPRSAGSGNIGATNVLRTLGKKAAVATLVGDFLKGAIPVIIAVTLLPANSAFIYFTAGAAILGHDFSFLLAFKGGKGVATTIGTLTVLSPLTALLLLATWVSVVAVTRYSSAGALTAAAMAPVFALLVIGDGRFALYCLFAAVLLSFQHRENIKRLIAGTESRVGEKESSESKVQSSE
jgi:glycerol-3-phosphate acyltransferase PlsY